MPYDLRFVRDVNRRIRAPLVLAACFGASACCNDTVGSVRVWLVDTNSDLAEVTVGETASLSALASDRGPRASYSCDLYRSSTDPELFTFSSTNPSVASVDGSGVLTAVSEGEATVRAVVDGVTSNDLLVVVRAAGSF